MGGGLFGMFAHFLAQRFELYSAGAVSETLASNGRAAVLGPLSDPVKRNLAGTPGSVPS